MLPVAASAKNKAHTTKALPGCSSRGAGLGDRSLRHPQQVSQVFFQRYCSGPLLKRLDFLSERRSNTAWRLKYSRCISGVPGNKSDRLSSHFLLCLASSGGRLTFFVPSRTCKPPGRTACPHIPLPCTVSSSSFRRTYAMRCSHARRCRASRLLLSDAKSMLSDAQHARPPAPAEPCKTPRYLSDRAARIRDNCLISGPCSMPRVLLPDSDHIEPNAVYGVMPHHRHAVFSIPLTVARMRSGRDT